MKCPLRLPLAARVWYAVGILIHVKPSRVDAPLSDVNSHVACDQFYHNFV
jgi:hypothetical protein